jgi:hypothetical protein
MDPTLVWLCSLPRRNGEHCVVDVDPLPHRLGPGGSLQLGLCKVDFPLPSASLGGCVYLLQLWMWSRLLVARPVVLAPRDWFPVQNACLQPTWAYLWDQVTVPHARMERAYKEYTDKLDRLMTSSVSTNYYTCWFERNYLLSYLTYCLDTLQVTWEPYADDAALPFVVSNVCDSDSELYRVTCPLICFYAVEYHLPHRVAC